MVDDEMDRRSAIWLFYMALERLILDGDQKFRENIRGLLNYNAPRNAYLSVKLSRSALKR